MVFSNKKLTITQKAPLRRTRQRRAAGLQLLSY